ncbi:MAG: hypothetical protein H6839_10565 [Planctomycetes bacterium]|nr:hypothetical protein [Planctomycetota bacterium]
MDDIPTNAAAFRRSAPETESGLRLTLRVTDPEVLAELQPREGAEREQYALTALRVGVIALRQAGTLVDTESLKDEGERLVELVETRLKDHAKTLDTTLQNELSKYFADDGKLSERMKSLLSDDGQLAGVLEKHLTGDNSLLAKQLAEAVGKDSDLMKYLSADQQNGLVQTITRVAQERLEEQSKKVLGEFDLNNDQSALKRLITQIETNFNPDDPKTALGVLKKALGETQEQIRKDLSLDTDGSALSNLHGKLKKQIDELVERQAKFQTEVASVLAELRGAKKERAVSPSGGFDFESLSGDALRERMHSDELFESVGETTGLVARSKVGDHVQTLGADSAAPGAKVVYECKRAESYTLAKALAELDEARRNRGSEVGVFVLAASSVRGNPKMQAEFPRALMRQGNDIVVIWDPEDEASDVNLDAAVTLARAYAVRERGEEDAAADVDWEAVDRAIHGVERQIEYINDLNTWTGNITRDAEKIADRLGKMKKDLNREMERLTEQIENLRP